MEIDNLFGIPAHPLLVHIPIILVPVTAVFALLAVAVQRHRRRLAWFAAALTTIALISAQFAIGSGQALQDRVKDEELVRRHVEIGDQVRLYLALLLVVLVVLAMLPHGTWSGQHAQRRRTAVAVVSLLVAVAAVANVVVIIQVGHSGAKAVWNDTPAAGTLPAP